MTCSSSALPTTSTFGDAIPCCLGRWLLGHVRLTFVLLRVAVSVLLLLRHGKDFHKISREIGSISTKECVEYFYANKYRKGRKFLRDSVMLQELYGNDGFGVPIMPLSALPVREPLTSTNSSDAVASGVPLSFASIPMDTPLDSAVESTSIKPESTTDDPPVVPVSTDEGKVDAGSDGESGSELSEATNDAGNQVPAGSVSNASAKKARNGKDKNRPQRQRKTEPTWCTTCMVARSAVLACMWDKCGNTVCRTCYSQQSASYRARAVGETWRGGVLNPFWLCLACTSGKGVETGGGTPGTSGYVGLINLRDSMLITTARSVKPPTKLGSSPQIQPSHKPGKTLPSDQPLAESRKRRITAGPDAENMPAQRQKVVNPRQSYVDCLMLLLLLSVICITCSAAFPPCSTFPPDGMPFVRDAQAMLDLYVPTVLLCVVTLFCSDCDLCVYVCSRCSLWDLQCVTNVCSCTTRVPWFCSTPATVP